MDFLIDPYRMTPAAPSCGEVLIMVKQSQTDGGAAIGDGMPQSGTAVTARANFLGGLASFLSDDLQGRTPTKSVRYNRPNPLALWSGLGSLAALPTLNIDEFIDGTYSVIVNGPVSGSNGRFNTSSNSPGNWYEVNGDFEITLTTPKTAFGFYITDMGDFRQGECELQFYFGTTLVRNIQLPIVFLDKPGPNGAMWVGVSDGARPFDKIAIFVWQHSLNPGARDTFGFDDFAIGDVMSCVPGALAQIHYGANIAGDAAKTVTGAALAARNAFAASVTSLEVCDFESMAVGAVGAGAAISFSGGVTGALTCYQYSADHNTISTSATDVIDNNGASARWNTTSAGSKWYEFTDELNITLSVAVRSFGLYITNLGTENATLRITLRNSTASANRSANAGVSYYVPKATALSSAASLLRFWGVTGEAQFDRITIQTVYYTTLTDLEFENPVFHVKGTPQMVGIDDLLIGN